MAAPGAVDPELLAYFQQRKALTQGSSLPAVIPGELHTQGGVPNPPVSAPPVAGGLDPELVGYFRQQKGLVDPLQAQPLSPMAPGMEIVPDETWIDQNLEKLREIGPLPKRGDKFRGFTVTSALAKGGHNKGSKHYQGKAFDLRTRDKTPEQVAALIAQLRGEGYKVLDERTRPKGQAVWGGPHLHVEPPSVGAKRTNVSRETVSPYAEIDKQLSEMYRRKRAVDAVKVDNPTTVKERLAVNREIDRLKARKREVAGEPLAGKVAEGFKKGGMFGALSSFGKAGQEIEKERHEGLTEGAPSLKKGSDVRQNLAGAVKRKAKVEREFAKTGDPKKKQELERVDDYIAKLKGSQVRHADLASNLPPLTEKTFPQWDKRVDDLTAAIRVDMAERGRLKGKEQSPRWKELNTRIGEMQRILKNVSLQMSPELRKLTDDPSAGFQGKQREQRLEIERDALGTNNKNPIARAASAFLQGAVYAPVSAAAGIGEALGVTGEKTARGFGLVGDAAMPKDPTRFEQVASGVGSVASSMVTALPIGGAVATIATAGKAAKWAAPIVFGLQEAATNGGHTFQMLRAEGKSVAEARGAATKQVMLEAVPNILAAKLGFFSEAKGAAALITRSAPEALQEGYQQAIQNISTGRKWDEGIKDAALVGGLVGLIFAGGSAVADIKDARTRAKVEAALKAEIKAGYYLLQRDPVVTPAPASKVAAKFQVTPQAGKSLPVAVEKRSTAIVPAGAKPNVLGVVPAAAPAPTQQPVAPPAAPKQTVKFDDNAEAVAPVAPERKQMGVEEPVDLAKVKRKEVPEAQKGAKGKAVVPKMGDVDFSYAVVDLKDLVISHDKNFNPNPKFAETLQPRDRTELNLKKQVEEIAADFDPRQVADSIHASTGAPIIGPDHVVEAGNGRLIAFRKTKPSKVKAYREFLDKNAAKFGLTPEQIAAVRNPVLVRVRETEMTPAQREEYVRLANERVTAAESTTDQAKTDTSALTDDVVNFLVENDLGDISNPANNRFAVAFIDKLSTAPRSDMMDAQGALSQQGIRRIEAAVLNKAYGSKDLTSKAFEDIDPNVKRILTGLKSAAPSYLKYRSDVEKGDAHNLDISTEIVDTVLLLDRLREQGMSPKDYIDQDAMFDSEADTRAKEILNVLAVKTPERGAIFDSAKRVREFIHNYVELARKQGKPSQGALVKGEAVKSKDDLIKQAAAQVAGETASLFGMAEAVVQGTQKPAETKAGILDPSKFKTKEAFINAHGDMVYHGGGKQFGSTSEMNFPNNQYTVGAFFTSDQATAGRFGKEVTPAVVRFKKPFVVDAKEAHYNDIKTPKEMKGFVHESMDTVETDNIAEYAVNHGYDGAIIKNVVEGFSGAVTGWAAVEGYGEATNVYIAFGPESVHTVAELEKAWNEAVVEGAKPKLDVAAEKKRIETEDAQPDPIFSPTNADGTVEMATGLPFVSKILEGMGHYFIRGSGFIGNAGPIRTLKGFGHTLFSDAQTLVEQEGAKEISRDLHTIAILHDKATHEYLTLISAEVKAQWGVLANLTPSAAASLRGGMESIAFKKAHNEPLSKPEQALWNVWAKITKDINQQAKELGIQVERVVGEHPSADLLVGKDVTFFEFENAPASSIKEDGTVIVSGGGPKVVQKGKIKSVKSSKILIEGDNGTKYELRGGVRFYTETLVENETFFPIYLREDIIAKLEANDPATVEKQVQWLLDKKLADSREVAHRIIQDAIRDDTAIFVNGIAKSRLQVARKSHIFHPDFFDYNFERGAERYIRSATMDIATAKTWGADREGYAEKVSKLVNSNRVNQIVTAVTTPPASSAMTRSAEKIAKGISGSVSLAYLGFSAKTMATQFGATSQLVGTVGAIDAMKGLSSILYDKGFKGGDLIDEIKMSGVTDQDLTQLFTGDDYSDKFTDLVRFSLIGMRAVDQRLRILSAATGIAGVRRAARKVMVDKDGKIKDNAAYRFLSDWARYQDEEIIELAKDQKALYERGNTLRVKAMFAGVKTQVTSRAIDRPYFTHNNKAVEVAMRLRTYGFKQMQLMGWTMKEATKGNFTPLLRLLIAGAIVGDGVEWLKDLFMEHVLHTPPEERRKNGLYILGLLKEGKFDEALGELPAWVLNGNIKAGTFGLYNDYFGEYKGLEKIVVVNMMKNAMDAYEYSQKNDKGNAFVEWLNKQFVIVKQLHQMKNDGKTYRETYPLPRKDSNPLAGMNTKTGS